MASTLPDANNCCTPCESPTTVNIPGTPGEDGDPGPPGDDGVSPFTTFTALFTIPAELASDVATVADTSWMVIGQKLYGSRTDGSIHAFLEVVAIGGPTTVTLKNLEDTPNGMYAENSAPTSTLTIGSNLIVAGIQGPAGLLTGAAGGDLKGNYPNPTLAIGNTKGSILAGNGTDTIAVPAGTNGHMLAYDSTDAEGIKSFAALPLTGGTDVSDNRIARLDGTTGLPIPMQSSRVTVTDNGAIRADGSGGNARGTDAIDLQVTRAAATQVASGTNSSIGGGQNNTASNTNSTVAGGTTNASTGTASSVGGGSGNTASGSQSTVAGGLTNTASASNATVAGGTSNTANAATATVGGGTGNLASGTASVVAGGQGGTASGPNSFLGGGFGNDATGTRSVVAGGFSNLASADYASVPGGWGAVAERHGQMSRASGPFASDGDAQMLELMWRNVTTDATPTELFLDGISLQATIADGTSWIFRIMLVARRSTGTTSIYESVGQISRVGATTAVAGVTTTELNDGIGLPATPVTVDADNATEALRITVTGVAGNTIRWVAHARIVQVIH